MRKRWSHHLVLIGPFQLPPAGVRSGTLPKTFSPNPGIQAKPGQKAPGQRKKHEMEGFPCWLVGNESPSAI